MIYYYIELYIELNAVRELFLNNNDAEIMNTLTRIPLIYTITLYNDSDIIIRMIIVIIENAQTGQRK